MIRSMLTPLLFFILLVAMILFIYIGAYLAKRIKSSPQEESNESQILQGSIFALLGLLIAFTFSGANMKFDSRRHLIIDEANAIGTAYLRLDLLQAKQRREIQTEFHKYVTSRLEVYRKIPDIDAVMAELQVTANIRDNIWNLSITSCKKSNSTAACMLLLPALNEMFDLANTRYAITAIHPPMVILFLLLAVAFTGSLLAGYTIKYRLKRNLVLILSYSSILALTIFIIIDIEHPLIGMIRIDNFGEELFKLRETMNSPEIDDEGLTLTKQTSPEADETKKNETEDTKDKKNTP